MLSPSELFSLVVSHPVLVLGTESESLQEQYKLSVTELSAPWF